MAIIEISRILIRCNVYFYGSIKFTTILLYALQKSKHTETLYSQLEQNRKKLNILILFFCPLNTSLIVELVLQYKTPICAMFTLHVLILFFLFIIFCYLLFTVFYLFFLFLMAAPRSLMQEAIFPLASSHQISMGTFGPFYTIIITFHHSSNCTRWNIYVKKE